MNKRLICTFVLALLLISFVGAQVGVPVGIEQEGEKILNQTGRLQEFIDGERWKYLGEQWQETLLKNEVIARFDSAFTNLNFVFLILFARDYSLSATLLFVFLIWLFTVLSLDGYLLFIENKNYRYLAAIAVTIGLAHIQVFNFLAEGAFKVIFYRAEWWWSLISFIAVVVAMFVYLYINRAFAASIAKGAEEGRKSALEHRVRKQEEYQEGVSKGTS